MAAPVPVLADSTEPAKRAMSPTVVTDEGGGDAEVDVTSLSIDDLLDMGAASTSELWVDAPEEEADGDEAVLSGTVRPSSTIGSSPQALASVKFHRPSAVPASYPRNGLLHPIGKQDRDSVKRSMSASQPGPSQSRSAPATQNLASGSASQSKLSRFLPLPAKRLGQFKIPKKPTDQPPSNEGTSVKRRLDAADRTNEIYQRGGVPPRSPSRGRRSAPSADDMRSSPPPKAIRRRL